MLQLPQTVRNGFRMLGHARGLAIVAVLTLGIAVNVAVLAVVYAVLVQPLPHPDSDRLVAISSRNLPTGRDHQMAPLDFFDFEQGSSSFERLAAYYPPGFTLTGTSVAERVPGARATSGIFDVFGVRPALGRGFLPAEDHAGTPLVAVISHSLWSRRFESDPGIVGRAITLSGSLYTVVGVLPDGFDTPVMWPRMPEVWVPLGVDPNVDSREARMLRVIGRLRADASVERAGADLSRIAAGLPAGEDTGVTVTSMLEHLTRDVRPSLLILVSGVAALLLVSTGNAAGLILAGTLRRRREFATRLAIGASRRQITRQIVGENLVLGAVASVSGFVMAYLASDLLVQVAVTAGVPRAAEIQVGSYALFAGLGLSLGCTAICAAIAADIVVRRASASGLSRNARDLDRSQQRTYAVLLAAEAAFSLALLTAGGLLVRSFYELRAVDPGFDAEQTYTLRLSPPAARYPAGPVLAGFYDRVLDRVRALPGVESATVVDWLPASGAGSMTGFTTNGTGDRDRHLAELRIVGSDYFGTLAIPVRSGRVFDSRDRDGNPHVVVVNESFARAHFATGGAVGRSVTFDRGGEPFSAEIVGVASDVREVSRRLAPAPGVYAPKTQMPWMSAETRDLVVRAEDGRMPDAAAIQAVVRELEPDAPIGPVERLSEVTSVPIVRTELYATAVAGFATIAVLLAAFGIYGAVSSSVAHRSRQIGIRMALGATSIRVIEESARRGIAPAIAGLAAGVPLALGSGRVVRQQLFGVQPNDMLTLASVGGAMLVVAVVAALIPALRAARVDPAITLRHESAP